jgi:hypothetical protein
MECPCCGDQLTISQANLDRLYDAIKAACPPGPGQVSLDIGAMPADIDWTGPVTDADIQTAITAAVTFDPPAGP